MQLVALVHNKTMKISRSKVYIAAYSVTTFNNNIRVDVSSKNPNSIRTFELFEQNNTKKKEEREIRNKNPSNVPIIVNAFPVS